MLSVDHRLDSNPSEVERVKQVGGKIARAMDKFGRPAGPPRLWPGGVAMARTIGDSDVLHPETGVHFIEATPDVATTAARAGDLIICSDGVWDSLLAEDVARFSKSSYNIPAQKGAELVVREAVGARHAYDCDGYQVPLDDTTCVLMRIGNPGARNKSSGCCS